MQYREAFLSSVYSLHTHTALVQSRSCGETDSVSHSTTVATACCDLGMDARWVYLSGSTVVLAMIAYCI
jgi:hypothetical protein